DEMSATPWFPVGPDDVFPSEFGSFLGLSPELRETFLADHGDLLTARWWNSVQGRLAEGEIVSIYPYSQLLRLSESG
ncbi:MAG: isocitrate dehydrogenase kinase/phosphatase-domain containing protein, partial [Acidimicrobiia bacterium]